MNGFKKILIGLVGALFLIAPQWMLTHGMGSMESHSMNDCIFETEAGALCNMNGTTHLSHWKQLFTFTPRESDALPWMILGVTVAFFLTFHQRNSFDLHTRPPTWIRRRNALIKIMTPVVQHLYQHRQTPQYYH